MMIPENTSRKIDSLGRITIPKGLRDRLSIGENDELNFYMVEEGGNQFIAMGRAPLSAYENAAKVLEELGVEIPEELAAKI